MSVILSPPECCALSKWAETEGVSLAVIPAQAGIQFLLLDSGSRPTALPGMTGCQKCPAWVKDFISEQQQSEESHCETLHSVQGDRLSALILCDLIWNVKRKGM